VPFMIAGTGVSRIDLPMFRRNRLGVVGDERGACFGRLRDERAENDSGYSRSVPREGSIRI
jgi:hypothetical protein